MSRGFSTLELLIALMILTSTLAAVTLIAFGIPEALENGRAQEEAMSQANYLMQEELHVGMHSFEGVSSIATSTLDGFDSALVSTILPDGMTKELVSSVHYWVGGIGAAGIPENLALTAFVTDFEDISTTQMCDSVLIGDWKHPQSMVFTMKPGSLLPSTFPSTPYPITSLALGTSTLVAAVSSSTARTDPTIFLFSLASSTHPVYVGSVDTATSTKYGENAVAVNGSTIYAASGYPASFSTCTTGPTCSQIQILDASVPANPVIETYFQLATSSGPYATGTSGQSTARALFYADGFLYVGLQKTGAANGDEFNIVDVHDPRSPVWIGGYSIGRSINQIQVQNGFAYLATDDPSRELVVLDVHTPANPVFASSYDAPGSSIFGYGDSVAVTGTSASTTVVLGRSFTYNGPGMSVLSSVDARNTALSSTTERTSVAGIVLQSFMAFVLTSTQLEFWNLADLVHPVAYEQAIPLPGSSTAAVGGMMCRHSTLYVASTDASHAGYLTILTGS